MRLLVLLGIVTGCGGGDAAACLQTAYTYDEDGDGVAELSQAWTYDEQDRLVTFVSDQLEGRVEQRWFYAEDDDWTVVTTDFDASEVRQRWEGGHVVHEIRDADGDTYFETTIDREYDGDLLRSYEETLDGDLYAWGTYTYDHADRLVRAHAMAAGWEYDLRWTYDSRGREVDYRQLGNGDSMPRRVTTWDGSRKESERLDFDGDGTWDIFVAYEWTGRRTYVATTDNQLLGRVIVTETELDEHGNFVYDAQLADDGTTTSISRWEHACD